MIGTPTVDHKSVAPTNAAPKSQRVSVAAARPGNQAILSSIQRKRTFRQTSSGTTGAAPTAARPTTQDCTAAQATMIRHGLADARKWLNDAEPKVTSFGAGTLAEPTRSVVATALSQNFHSTTRPHEATIATNFAQLRRALNGPINYECASAFWCGDNELAYVRGGLGWIRRQFDVNICPSWFSSSYLKRVSTLIHERAHQYPGATDNAYEWSSAYGSLSASDAIDNAESYAVTTRQIYHGGAHGPGIGH